MQREITLFAIITGGRIFDALRQIERETQQLIRTTKLQSNLETIAHEKGFTISENEGGGNCMFIALSQQLGQGKGIKISHKELRQRVVQYLKENPKMVSILIVFLKIK